MLMRVVLLQALGIFSLHGGLDWGAKLFHTRLKPLKMPQVSTLIVLLRKICHQIIELMRQYLFLWLFVCSQWRNRPSRVLPAGPCPAASWPTLIQNAVDLQ